MDAEPNPLERLDSFPYRRKLSDVMARPVVTAPSGARVLEACAEMHRHAVSSLLVLDPDQRLAGIVTQADIVALLARHQAAALDRPLDSVMSSPVLTVSGDCYLYVAIARMDRMRLRHLVVVDDRGQPIGMVTPRQLLQVRARQALILGDDIEHAGGAAELRAARGSVPILARGLKQDGTPVRAIAAVISQVIRDITARGAALVEAALQADGWGAAPARYALLVLGSAGRGESLLTFDQDNALVHDGDAGADPWFAEFGKRLNALLDDAGIQLCQGEVMVRNPAWRRSLTDWQATLRDWVFQPAMQSLLNVDIFFDLQPVWGDRDLAERLRESAFGIAAQSAFFLQFLAQATARLDSPLGAFGRLVTDQGRLDAKKYGLLPLVQTARVRAIQAGIMAPATRDRWAGLAAAGKLHDEDFASLDAAHTQILDCLLEQQLADLAAGLAPCNRLAPAHFPAATQKRLRQAFQRIKTLQSMASNVMAV